MGGGLRAFILPGVIKESIAGITRLRSGHHDRSGCG